MPKTDVLDGVTICREGTQVVAQLLAHDLAAQGETVAAALRSLATLVDAAYEMNGTLSHMKPAPRYYADALARHLAVGCADLAADVLRSSLLMISELTPRMQRATAEYLYDRFVRNPPPHAEIQPAGPKEG